MATNPSDETHEDAQPTVRLPVSTEDVRQCLFDNGQTLIEHVHGSIQARRLVVTFPHYGSINVHAHGYAEDFLRGLGFDVLSVKCWRNTWLQDVSIEEMTSVIATLTPYEEVVTYGSSMGGYAAMYFADAVGARRVVAISPQYSIDPEFAAFEHRWAQDATGIEFRHGPLSAVLKTTEADHYVVYDPQSPDERHVELMRAMSDRVISVPVRYSGHPSGVMLHETGLLGDVFIQLASGQVPNLVANIRKNRTKSATYLIELAQACTARHPKVANALFSRAVKLGDRVDVLILYSQFLYSQHDWKKALAMYERAAPLYMPDVHRIAYRGHLNELCGNDAAALEAYGEAIELEPNFLPFYTAERRVLRKNLRTVTLEASMMKSQLDRLEDTKKLHEAPQAAQLTARSIAMIVIVPLLVAFAVWAGARAFNLV